jgi:hypothetical protein
MNRELLVRAEYLAAKCGGTVDDYLDGYEVEQFGRWRRYKSGERRGRAVVDIYDYRKEDGTPYLRVERTEDKQFPQSHWEGNQWKVGKPKGAKIPYLLPELVAAHPALPIFICEGEKDANSVTELGLVATCASEGAGKWTSDLNKWFEGWQCVFILEDNDAAGRSHARLVARNLSAVVNEVRIISLPGLEEHGDVSDWIKAGGTKDKLVELYSTAPLFVPRPVIHVTPGNLSSAADQAEAALLAAGAPLYQRSRKLVRPILDQVEAARGLRTNVVHLKEVDPIYLRDLLGRITDFTRPSMGGPLLIDPPLKVAATLLARAGEWKFPKVAGVISTPTMRPDGTILSQEGYDESTQLLLLGSPTLPPIPEAPTLQDAKEAKARLEDLLSEFEFVSEVGRAVALSALITPIVRGAFSVTPAHVAQAPVAGSGKSFLWDIVAAIAIGQPMPVMSAGGNQEETEKRLGSALMAGQPLISIDNVNGLLGGDALCQIIERPIVDIRILGKSECMRIEARGTSVFATGNNINLVGDVCRRALIAQLDPQIERPELRVFKGNPVKTVLADRGFYIACALTICRAYVIAGRPGRADRLASFEDWSDTVRSPLIWLGTADPVESMEIARAEDPELSALKALLLAWSEVIGLGWGSRVTLQDIIDLADSVDLQSGASGQPQAVSRYPQLAQAVKAVASGRRGLDAAALGQWAKRVKGRFAEGLRLVNKPNPKGSSEWWVEDQHGTERQGQKDVM